MKSIQITVSLQRTLQLKPSQFHRGHSRSQWWDNTANTGTAHNDLTQSTEATATTIDLTTTHHIDHNTVPHNIKALQVINPEITVGHIHDHPTDLQGMSVLD